MTSRPAIILFNPATWRGVGDATAPWGPISLATFLLDDYDVHFFDQRFDREWRTEVEGLLTEGNVLMAGTTGMTGLQLKGAVDFLRHVRSLAPNVSTVFGGVHASMLPEDTVAHEVVDYVVVGEAEFAVKSLADALAAGAGPPDDDSTRAILWKGKKNGCSYALIDDLDSLPEPPWQRFSMRRYVTRTSYGRTLSIVTSRGCPHGCAFCIHSSSHLKSKWRSISAAKAVDFMHRLARELDVEHFHIQDDNFFVSTARVEEFVSMLADNLPPFTWTVGGAHIVHLKRYAIEFFRTMRRAGCVRLLIGAESGSAAILERIGKRQATGEVLQVNRLLCDAGIRPIYSFISGVPGETDDDLLRSVRLMADLRRYAGEVDVGTIKPLVFYPGTRFYDWALDNGFVPPQTLEGWTGISWDHYLDLPYPWLSPQRRRFLIRLYYSSLLWNPHYHWVNSRLFTVAARTLMPVTNWRMLNLNFNYSLMPAIMRIIQHKALS